MCVLSLIISTLLMIAPLQIHAQDYSGVEWVGTSFNSWESTTAIDIRDDYAYLMTWLPTSLQVFDVSNPEQPASVGMCYYDMGTPNSLTIYRNCAYATTYYYQGDYGREVEEDLIIFDISDPLNPVYAGGVDLPEGACGVSIQGDYAYVTASEEGLYVIDVSDPRNPEITGNFNLLDYYISKAVVRGNYVYVNDSFGLSVIDVSDPENPDMIAVCLLDRWFGWASRMHIEGGIAYISNDVGGLWLVDISDPMDPQSITFVRLWSYEWIIDVIVRGNIAYVIDVKVFMVFDISDRENPELLSEYGYGLNGPAQIGEGYAYVVGYTGSGVGIIDLSDLENVEQVGLIRANAWVYDVVAADGYAYALSGHTVNIIDVANPRTPLKLGSFNISYSRDFTVIGNYAYTVGYTFIEHDFGLLIHDISDPENPDSVSFIEISGSYHNLAVLNDYAYVESKGTRNGGLRVIDISDPADPLQIGHLTGIPEANDMAAAGEFVYMSCGWNGLRVFDVSDPENPDSVGLLDEAWRATGIDVSGNYAYISAYIELDDGDHTKDGGLYIIDITDPMDPFQAAYFDTPGEANSVAVDGNFAYIADDWKGGLRVIDITNPEEPREAGFFNTVGEALKVFAIGRYAYVADGANLGIFDCNAAQDVNSPVATQPESFSLLSAYPNPFNSATTVKYGIPNDSEVSLAVYDINGKLVHTLFSGDQTAGHYSIRYSAGNLPTGVYVIKLETNPGDVHFVKAVLVK